MDNLEKEAQKMTQDILSSVGKENDPIAILIEGYILKKIKNLLEKNES